MNLEQRLARDRTNWSTWCDDSPKMLYDQTCVPLLQIRTDTAKGAQGFIHRIRRYEENRVQHNRIPFKIFDCIDTTHLIIEVLI